MARSGLPSFRFSLPDLTPGFNLREEVGRTFGKISSTFFSSAGPFQTIGRGARLIAGPLLVGAATGLATGIGVGLGAGLDVARSPAGPFQTIGRAIGLAKGPVGDFFTQLGTATRDIQRARFGGVSPPTHIQIGGTFIKVAQQPRGNGFPATTDVVATTDVTNMIAAVRGTTGFGGGGLGAVTATGLPRA